MSNGANPYIEAAKRAGGVAAPLPGSNPEPAGTPEPAENPYIAAAKAAVPSPAPQPAAMGGKLGPATPPAPAATPLNPYLDSALKVQPVGSYAPHQLDALINQSARKYGIDPLLLRRLVHAESGGNHKAVSKTGALGLAQLMPGTARDLGVDPNDPKQNLEGGAKYLRQLLVRYKGDVARALAAYNAGPGAVDKAGGVPGYPETQAYVKRILAGYPSGRDPYGSPESGPLKPTTDVKVRIESQKFLDSLRNPGKAFDSPVRGAAPDILKPWDFKAGRPAWRAPMPTQPDFPTLDDFARARKPFEVPTTWNGIKWADDPFRELPFDAAAFQAYVDDPRKPVRLRNGRSMAGAEAARRVAKATGVSSFLATGENIDRGMRSDEADVENEVGNTNRLRAENHYIGRAIAASRAGDRNAATVALQTGIGGAGVNQTYRGIGAAADLVSGGGVQAMLANATDKKGNPLSQDQRNELLSLYGQFATMAVGGAAEVLAGGGLAGGAAARGPRLDSATWLAREGRWTDDLGQLSRTLDVPGGSTTGGAGLVSKNLEHLASAANRADIGLMAGQSGLKAMDVTAPDDQRTEAFLATMLMAGLASGGAIAKVLGTGGKALAKGLDRIKSADNVEQAVRRAMSSYSLPRSQAEAVVRAIEDHVPDVAFRKGPRKPLTPLKMADGTPMVEPPAGLLPETAPLAPEGSSPRVSDPLPSSATPEEISVKVGAERDRIGASHEGMLAGMRRPGGVPIRTAELSDSELLALRRRALDKANASVGSTNPSEIAAHAHDIETLEAELRGRAARAVDEVAAPLPDGASAPNRQAFHEAVIGLTEDGTLSPGKAHDVLALWEARARSWARENGSSLEDFYTRFGPELRVVDPKAEARPIGVLWRQVFPEDERLDVFADAYDPKTVDALHQDMFGEPAPRVDGEVSDGAAEDVRQELLNRHMKDSHQVGIDDYLTGPEYKQEIDSLAYSTGVKRRGKSAAQRRTEAEEKARIAALPEDERKAAKGEATLRRASKNRFGSNFSTERQTYYPAWKNANGKVIADKRNPLATVDLSGVPQDVAQAIYQDALTQGKNTFFVTGSEYRTAKKMGGEPRIYTIDEVITREFHADDVLAQGFDGWGKIALPRSFVARWVEGELGKIGAARERIAARSLRLSDEEFSAVVKYYTDLSDEGIAAGDRQAATARGENADARTAGDGGPQGENRQSLTFEQNDGMPSNPMLAIHNTSPDGILAADKLGGIPAPSVAVTKPGQGLEGYGNISLVGRRDIADPAVPGNRLYDADVYSPRQPKPIHTIKRDQISTVSKAFDAAYRDMGYVDDSVKEFLTGRLRDAEGNQARIVQDVAHAGYGRLAFLRSLGMEIELPQTKDYFDKFRAVDDALRERFGSSQAAREATERWVAEQLAPAFGYTFMKIGGKSVDYSLENILRVMTKKVRAAEGGMAGTSLGAQRSKGAVQFKTLEQARANLANIVGKEGMNAAKDATEQAFSDFNSKLTTLWEYDTYKGNPPLTGSNRIDYFRLLDAASDSLGDFLKVKNGTPTSMKLALRRNGFTGPISDELAAEGVAMARRLVESPTEYFEAKPARAVGLGEFAGAAVRPDTPPAVIEALKRNGLDVRVYDPNVKAGPGSRTAVIDAIAAENEGALFQQAPKGPKGQVTFTEGERPVVELFRGKADLSTVIHESAHIWRRTLGEGDLEILASHYGDFAAADAAVARAAEERFARGMERYLRDGQAPTEELRGVFERARVWLKQIYKKVVGSPIGEEINPEVREVFDRMFSAERDAAGTVPAGGRVPAEPLDVPPATVDDPGLTGLSMAKRREEAERLGTAMPQSVKGMTNAEAHAAGQADVEAGRVNPEELVARLGEEGRAATPQEWGAILEGRRRLIKVVTDAHEAYKAAKGTPGETDALDAYRTVLRRSDAFDRNLDAAKGAAGSSMQALKIGSTVDEGVFEEVRLQAQARKGDVPLTDAETSKLQADVDRLRALLEEEKADHALTRSLNEAMAKKEAEQVVSRAPRGGSGRRTKDAIRAERTVAIGDLRRAAVRIGSTMGAGVPEGAVDYFKALAKVANLYIEEGVVNLAELVERMRTHLKEEGIELLRDGEGGGLPEGTVVVMEGDIYAALAGKHLAETGPPLPEMVAKNRLLQMARLASKMRDLMDGTAAPAGAVRAPLDPQVQAMQSQLDAMREALGGKNGKEPDPLEALRAQLEDALHTLAYGPEEPTVNAPRVPSAEEVKLKDRIKDVREKIVARYGGAEEVRAADALIARLERELEAERAKTPDDVRQPVQGPPEARVAELRAQLAEARADFNEKYGTPVEQTKIAALQRQVDKLEDTLANGPKDVAPVVGPETAEVSALRERAKDLSEKIKAKYGGPAAAPSLQKALDAVNARIAEKEAQLAGGYRPVRKVRPPTPDALKAARQKLRDADLALKADDRLMDLEDQLRTGDFSRTTEAVQRRAEQRAARIARQTREQAERLRKIDLARKQVQLTIANMVPQSFGEKARILQRASRLTNPMARFYDVLSNTVVLADRQAGKPLEAASDWLLFGKARKAEGASSSGWSITRARKTAKGSLSRWRDELIEHMTVGNDPLTKKLGSSDLRTGSEGLNKAVDFINRFAGSTDIPFKDTVKEGVLRELAEAKAKLTGGDAEAIYQAAKEGTGHEDILVIAENESIEAVFGNDSLGARTIDKATKAFTPGQRFFLDLIMPFPRIFSNIVSYGTDFVPGSALFKANFVRSASKSGASGAFTMAERRVINRLVARNLRGAAYMYLGYKLAEKKLLQGDIGGQNSFVDWGELENMGGPTPIILLGATQYLAHHKGGLSPDAADGLVRKTAVGLIADQPAISGPVRFISNLEKDPGKAAGAAVSGLIPGIIREWARRQDQFRDGYAKGWKNGIPRRKTSGFVAPLKASFPFIRPTLPKQK